jgi:hypothetical protein
LSEQTRWLIFPSKIEEVLALKIQKKHNRLSRKLFKLYVTSPKKPNYKGTQQQLDNFVHNVAGVDFTEAELGLLNKSLNYVHLPGTLPIADIFVGVERALKLVPYEDRTSIRSRQVKDTLACFVPTQKHLGSTGFLKSISLGISCAQSSGTSTHQPNACLRG